MEVAEEQHPAARARARGIAIARRLSRRVASLRTRGTRIAGAAVAAALRHRTPSFYRPGVTVVTVNWNTLHYLERMLAAVEAMSPPGTEILVVDNASSDGFREFLRQRAGGVRVLNLRANVGHGIALDIAVPRIDTEYIAVLDVDAFPVSSARLEQSIAALDAGARVAEAHMSRNYVHPCFLVTRTELLHKYRLTFRPVGHLLPHRTPAPLSLDVGEALSQRVITNFGGGQNIHYFEATSIRGPKMAGAVFGGLLYHDFYATQGAGHGSALEMFYDAFAEHHPLLRIGPKR